MAFPEAIFSSPVAAYRGSLTDLVGSQNLTLSGNVSIGTTSSPGWGVSGRAVFNVGLGGHLDASTASLWKALHSGSGMTMWAVLKPDAGQERATLCDTGATATDVVGAKIAIDTNRGRLGFQINNGLGDGYVTDYVLGEWWTRDNMIGSDSASTLIIRWTKAQLPMFRVWVNGRQAGTFSLGDRWKDGLGPALDSGDPEAPLRLFLGVAGTNVFTGQLAEFGWTSRPCTTPERLAAEDSLSAYYGITMDRSQKGNLMIDGNSLFDDFWRKEGRINILPALIEDALPEPANVTNRGVAGLTTEQMLARAARHVTPNYDPQAAYNILIVWEILNSIDNEVAEQDIKDHIQQYCNDRRAEGWTVIVKPALVVSNLLFDATKLAKVESIRNWLRVNWPSFADAFSDPSTDPVIGVQSNAQSTTWRYDGVHFNDAGNVLAAPYDIAQINQEISMSIASPTDTDYRTTINTIRSHIGNGTQMSADEMRLAMAVIKNAISRINASNGGTDILSTTATNIAAQFNILDAFTAGSAAATIVAAIATASALLRANATALEASGTTVPTYVSSTVADG